jgi:hypothetical protein
MSSPPRLLFKNLYIKIYKTIIVPVVLYECETWSLTLREDHRLRVFETRVLRGIFWHKKEEVAGGWRRLHNEELHNLYPSPKCYWDDQVKEDEMSGECSSHEWYKKCIKILVGKPERKRPFGSIRRRCEDTVRMGLRELSLGVWTGFLWPGIETSGGLLWTR